MFHWTPHCITAHLGRCVMVLMLQRAAETITAMTWGHLRNRLAPVEAVRSTTDRGGSGNLHSGMSGLSA